MPIIIILLVLIIILLVTNIRVVPQATEFVIERLGTYYTTWETGLHFKVPLVDRVAKRISLKEQVMDFAPQPVITKDNVTMQIDTIVFYQVTDAKLYTYGVERPILAIESLTATTLRNIIGDMELDHTLTSRDVINSRITAALDQATDKWGIKVNRVELKNIVPPRDIQDAMEKQMRAERERREAILRAEGEKRSQILIAEGKKESQILNAEAEKQAAILLAEAEKEKKIREGQGEAESIMLVQKAQADAIRLLNEAMPSDKVLGSADAEGLRELYEGGRRPGDQDHHSQRNSGHGGSCRFRQGACQGISRNFSKSAVPYGMALFFGLCYNGDRDPLPGVEVGEGGAGGRHQNGGGRENGKAVFQIRGNGQLQIRPGAHYQVQLRGAGHDCLAHQALGGYP